MTQTTPQISVIVPVYNVEAHIGACITSLRRQGFADFEAIVIDDGSTDGSLARLRAAIAGDTRFKVIQQENSGLSVARNQGLNIAKAPFVAFLDGDDCYALTYLEKLHTALCDSQADWVACGMRNVFPGLRRSTTHSTIHSAPKLPIDRTPRLWSLSTWDETIAHFPSAWNKLYRRDLIEGLRFDTDTWFEDHTFFLRTAARSNALLHLPEPLYLQTRGRTGQITTSDSDRVFDQFTVLDTVAELLLQDAKPSGDIALPQLAHRLLYERSCALFDTDRRARFLAAARDWLERHDLPLEPGPGLPRIWARELAGEGNSVAGLIRPQSGLRDVLRGQARSPLRHLKRVLHNSAEETALRAALAEVARSVHDQPDVPDSLLDSLALPPARMLPLFYVTLSEPFCQRNAFEQLYDHAQRHLQTDQLRPSWDVWFNSGLLPFLLRNGQIELLKAQFRLLTKASGQWVMTAPLAWTIRAALDGASLPRETRDEIIGDYLTFLDRAAPDYWARTPCLALIETAVALIGAGSNLNPTLLNRAEATLIRAYGMLPEFWDRVSITHTTLSPRLIAARRDFDQLRQSTRPDPAVLARFDQAGCPDVIRFRDSWPPKGALRLLSPPARLDEARSASVAVVACMRNEMFMLPHFLAHYRRLGADSFLIADNGSDDETRDYLAEQPDVCLFSADTNYDQSKYGVIWQREILAHFRTGKWTLIADADELLALDRAHGRTLANLLQCPGLAEADAVRIFQLDMYPKEALSETDFSTGSPFEQACFIDQDPLLRTSLGRGPYSNAPTWTSAVRHRLIPSARADLFVAQKIALIKYSPFMRVAAGLHYACGVRLAKRPLFFGHFKYHAQFHEKAAVEAARGQHFNQAEEYRAYRGLGQLGRDRIYDPERSVLWHDSSLVASHLPSSGQFSPE